MNPKEPLSKWTTTELLTALNGRGWGNDLLRHQEAEAEVGVPRRVSDLVQIVSNDKLSEEKLGTDLRIRAARHLDGATLSTSDAQLIANLLVRQTLAPNSELVRRLLGTLSMSAGSAILHHHLSRVLHLLLHCSALDLHARLAVLEAIKPYIEVDDLEDLVARAVESEQERRLTTEILLDVLDRPLKVHRLTPSGFEHLACRMLEARGRARGFLERFRVVGGPYDGGVDGEGGNRYETGADDPGVSTVLVQCKNVVRLTLDALATFDKDVVEKEKPPQQVNISTVSPSNKCAKVFVTSANPKDVTAFEVEAANRNIELILGPQFVELAHLHLRRRCTLDS